MCDDVTTNNTTPSAINLPVEFLSENRWIVRKKKEPLSAITRHRVGNTDEWSYAWSSYAVAKFAVDDGAADGLGYVLPANKYTLFDYDHVIKENGSIPLEVEYELNKLNSYTEYSQSGRGIHCIVGGCLENPIRTTIGKRKFEVYGQTAHYVFLTGNIIPGYPSEIVENIQGMRTVSHARNTIHNRLYPLPQKEKRIRSTEGSGKSWTADYFGISIQNYLPTNYKVRSDGRLQGGSPHHGSTSGLNYIVDTRKNMWVCFHDGHKSFGDALQMWAVMSGICDCERFCAAPGSPERHLEWEEIKQELKKQFPQRYNDLIKEQKRKHYEELSQRLFYDE
jgi:putative DNA primase/helicase